MIGQVGDRLVVVVDDLAEIDRGHRHLLVLAELTVGRLQIGKIDAAKCLVLAGHRLRIVHRRGDELIEIDVLDVEGLAHVRAARAQQPCHLFLIAGAVELRLHRVGCGGDLTERKRQGKDFDEQRFHRTTRRARTEGETKPSPLKRPLQNGFLGCRVPFPDKYSRRCRCCGTTEPGKPPAAGQKKGCPKAAPDLSCRWIAWAHSAAGNCAGSGTSAAAALAAASFSRSSRMSASRLPATSRSPFIIAPVPAGIRRPTMTFSLRPSSVSTLPLTAASVRTRVVSWNDAAEMNERVCSEALVMPSSTGWPTAGFLPSSFARALSSSSSILSICSPWIRSVSPASSISTFCSIWRTITSMCLSLMATPCSR